jgi:hypothetical protein
MTKSNQKKRYGQILPGTSEVPIMAVPEKAVTIPACDEHKGFLKCDVILYWVCPVCGSPRGDIYNARSYDGSRSLVCHSWENPCGHVDKYWKLRTEAENNGLNL